MITFIDEKGTEHSALVAYSITNAVNGELSVKGTIYTNDKVLHGIGRGWRFRLDDEYYRITYAKPNDTGRQIEVEFDAVHQFFYDMSKSMVYTTLNGSKPFETYLQAIFSGSGYTYNLETTVGSIRKENFGNKSRLSLFNDIIKAVGLEFSVRGHVVRILKRIGIDLSTIVRKDFNMNELKIEKDINSFVTYQRGLGAWKDDEDHSKGRYETSYESPLSAIYGRIEADPVVDERYKETGKLLERLKENVDKSYKVSIEIDMEDLSRAGYRISRPNPGDYIMAINETLGFRQKIRIVSFTSEYDVGGNLISRKVICNDIGTVQRATSEISHLSRTLTDSIEGSERALQTATRALVSADGKNTNYFGDVKPLDVPKGTLRKGDRLFLTVGDKKQLYFWNGAEWELEPTEFDHEKFDMEFNRKSQEIKKAIQENRQKAEEALRNAGASTLLAQEAKRISERAKSEIDNLKSSSQTAIEQIESFKTQYGTKLNEVKSTADGLFTKMGAVETYISKDGQRQENLQRYARDESARQVSTIREQISRDYVGKSAYQEDVRGLEHRFSAISTQTNNDIASKIAQYKQTVDGQFASITSQIASKANQTDFQRVRETSQLYERIIGSNENDISNKVARMALTNQLFQVEVAKFVSEGGPNLVRNSGNPKDTQNWGYWTIEDSPVMNVGTHVFFYSGQRKLFYLDNSSRGTVPTSTTRFSLKRNTSYTVSLTAFNTWNLKGVTIYFLGRKFGENQAFTQVTSLASDIKFSSIEAVRKNFSFNSGECDEGYIRIDNNGTTNSDTATLIFGDVDVYEGRLIRPWQPSPDDNNEAVRSVQSQLDGSWAIQNINSAGDLVSGLNLGANGHNRLSGKLTHITGETLIERAVIKSAMVDKLKTANFEAGSVTTVVLDAEAVTAEKIKVDQALFNKLVANEAYLSQLFAKQAFINRVQSVAIDASQVRSGILSGDRIYGGTIRGTEINGTTITGNSRITIGDNGFLRPTQEGGLQINVPETYSASKGVGVQLFGRNFGEIPKGMFIYNSPNWNGGNLIGESVADTLLTVKGLTSLCNLYRGQPMSGLPINSNFRYGDPVGTLYRISFIAWDPRHGQMFVNDGTDTDGTWWFKPDASSSDKRLKTNIKGTDFEAIDFVNKLEFKQFDWKPDKFGYKKPYTNVGLIAQDVEKLDSSLVYPQGENLALDDFRLGNIALKAIQELALENKTLTHRLENLENERRTT